MSTLETIQCVGRNGSSQDFYISWDGVDELDNKLRVRVFENKDRLGECVEFAYQKCSDNPLVWRQTDMVNNGGKAFSAKGIPDSVIPKVAEHLNAVIESSPENESVQYGEEAVWRSPAADKVWKRLVDKGIASYDEQTRLYRTRS